MKIIKVLVDELPINLQMCPMRQAVSNSPYFVEVLCALKTGAFTVRYDQSINRCPNCPLALEHDNKKIAESVM